MGIMQMYQWLSFWERMQPIYLFVALTWTFMFDSLPVTPHRA